jgi:calcineurin-like phosphoesterase family protein
MDCEEQSSGIFFTADTHFGHKRILDYCMRPMTSVDEMDAEIIQKWNSVVRPQDTVFHLGDFARRNSVLYLKKLNGKIFIVPGSHDEEIRKLGKSSPICETKTNCAYIRPDIWTYSRGGVDITLCHYAMRVWPKSHYNTWHLFGHSHGRLEGQGKSFDIGVDCWDYTPVSLERVIDAMKSRPNNPNLVSPDTTGERN